MALPPPLVPALQTEEERDLGRAPPSLAQAALFKEEEKADRCHYILQRGDRVDHSLCSCVRQVEERYRVEEPEWVRKQSIAFGLR